MPEKKPQTLIDAYEGWLASTPKPRIALPFDARSTCFVTALPKRATLSELQQTVWWWKYMDEERCHRVFKQQGKGGLNPLVLWRERYQLSAYMYEFRARYDGRYEWDFGVPWILCNPRQHEFLRSLWPTIPFTWSSMDEGKKEWVQIEQYFNLEANDETLKNQFIAHIEKLRRDARIDKPPLGRGISRKPISFLPLELVDRQTYLDEKMNDSQRSQLSKAKKAYKSSCSALGLLP